MVYTGRLASSCGRSIALAERGAMEEDTCLELVVQSSLHLPNCLQIFAAGALCCASQSGPGTVLLGYNDAQDVWE